MRIIGEVGPIGRCVRLVRADSTLIELQQGSVVLWTFTLDEARALGRMLVAMSTE